MKLNFEDQLDEIRVKLYEQSKDLSREDFVKGINARGRAIAEQYNMTVIRSAADAPRQKKAAL